LIGKAREEKRTRPGVVQAALLASLAMAGWAHAGGARCWIDKGALVAPAAFGDIAGDFLIDLSAPTSALHVTRANEDGLEGEAATRDLVIAGRRLAGVTLPIVDLDARTAKFDTAINGVIGVDVLRRFIVEIDPAACRLRLLSSRPGLWRGGVRLAISTAGGRPLAPVRITDGVQVRTGHFAIDTADWPTTVGDARLSRPQIADRTSPVRLRAMEVGGRLFEQVPAVVQPQGGPAPGGTPPEEEARGAIGMAVWSQWRLRLDIRNGWLELAPPGRRQVPAFAGTSRRGGAG
jgi:hypothetical protein